jgi:hypothetical protein
LVTRPELLALFGEDEEPEVLARQYLYVPASSRDGGSSAREQAGCVFLHDPKVALLFPSDMSPLAHRRPDFGSLRHVAAGFSFMLGRLPDRYAYTSATFTVNLDHPDAVVRQQRPAFETTADSEFTDTVTTQLSAAVDSLAKLGAERTRVTGSTTRGGQLPVVTPEKRGRGDFGWHYEARAEVPLVSRILEMLAVIELPREVTELSGVLSAEAMIELPGFGGLRTRHRAEGAQPMPFRCALRPPA